MTLSKKNRFQNFLAEKEKIVAEANQYSNSNSSNGGNKTVKYLPFFSPNKMFIGRNEVRVTVLPNETDFFYEYPKHMCKVNDMFKQMVCLDDNCPLCKCVADHIDSLDKKTQWLLSAKKVDLMFVYNPYAKQIMKYEVQGQGIVDILRALNDFMDTCEDFDPDKDGFDIIFEQDGKWAKCVGVEEPSISIKEILNQATNAGDAVDEDGNIKSLKTEAMPYSVNTTKKYNNTTTQQILSVFLPGVNVSNYLYEIEEYTPQPKTNKDNDGLEYTDNDTDGSVVDVDDLMSNSDPVQPDSEDDDIRAWMNNRSNRRR